MLIILLLVLLCSVSSSPLQKLSTHIARPHPAELQYWKKDSQHFTRYWDDFHPDTKVDLVYTWVNGSDPVQVQLRSQYQTSHPELQADVLAARRSRGERKELWYSLTSVAQHMSWVNHIYIVTSTGQEPDLSSLQLPIPVTIVPDTTLYTNPQHLPTFNSASLETVLHRIPGLSSYYVYMNDDMLLMQKWERHDFIYEGYYKPRFSPYQFATCRTGVCRPTDSVAGQLMYTDKVITQKYGPRTRWTAAHSPILYHIPTVQRAAADFLVQWENTTSHQVRSSTELQVPAFFLWWLVENHYAYVLSDKSETVLVQLTDNTTQQDIENSRKFNTMVICLNDDIQYESSIPTVDANVQSALTHWFIKQFT